MPLYPPVVVKGRNAGRLHPDADNPREVAFAVAWERVNSSEFGRTPLVHQLFRRSSPQDQEDYATLIQWLGSNVGMCFLEDVVESCPEVREFMRAAVERADARSKEFDFDAVLGEDMRAPKFYPPSIGKWAAIAAALGPPDVAAERPLPGYPHPLPGDVAVPADWPLRGTATGRHSGVMPPVALTLTPEQLQVLNANRDAARVSSELISRVAEGVAQAMSGPVMGSAMSGLVAIPEPPGEVFWMDDRSYIPGPPMMGDAP